MFLHQKWLRNKVSIQQSKKKSIPAEIREALGGFVARNIALQPNFHVQTWRRSLPQVYARVKRASARPLFELQFGLHILPCFSANPWPRIEPWASQEKTNRKVNVTIALFNVRSMASREKFYLVKQTIVHDNYDIFVISESWLDPSTTNNDI